jgi:Na+/melibiose symporter-like transporter
MNTMFPIWAYFGIMVCAAVVLIVAAYYGGGARKQSAHVTYLVICVLMVMLVSWCGFCFLHYPK